MKFIYKVKVKDQKYIFDSKEQFETFKASNPSLTFEVIERIDIIEGMEKIVKPHQPTTRELLILFMTKQEQFNNKVQVFMEEQVKFNTKVQSFMDEQVKFNTKVQSFMDKQDQFNIKVQTYMDKQDQFNIKVQNYMDKQDVFNTKVQTYMDLHP